MHCTIPGWMTELGLGVKTRVLNISKFESWASDIFYISYFAISDIVTKGQRMQASVTHLQYHKNVNIDCS